MYVNAIDSANKTSSFTRTMVPAFQFCYTVFYKSVTYYNNNRETSKYLNHGKCDITN